MMRDLIRANALAIEPVFGTEVFRGVPASMRPTYYHPELDCLRFFAFASVFFYHATEIFRFNLGRFQNFAYVLFSTGCFGVDLFFCLSAFLITTILLQEKEATGQVRIRAFWIRRILRIWPLYYVFLIFSLFVIPKIIDDEIPLYHAIPLCFFFENWAVVLFGFLQSCAGPLWSISIEEQFYLIWPIAIKKFRNLLIPGLVLIAMANVFRFTHAPSPFFVLWCNSLTYLDTIGAGIVLATLFQQNKIHFSNRTRILITIIAASALPAYFFSVGDDKFFDGKDIMPYSIAATVCPMLLAGIYRQTFLSNNSLLIKTTSYLGKISYGLYVFHAFSIYFVGKHLPRVSPNLQTSVFGIIAAAIMTLLLAIASYHLLETPFLRLKRKQSYVVTH